MELTLAIKNLGAVKGADGVTRIGQKELLVIDKVTGEELTGKTGVLWGDRALITETMEVPLLTPEHVEDDPDDAGYMILVIRCDNAVNVK